jgi:hypothetical protein
MTDIRLKSIKIGLNTVEINPKALPPRVFSVDQRLFYNREGGVTVARYEESK